MKTKCPLDTIMLMLSINLSIHGRQLFSAASFRDGKGELVGRRDGGDPTAAVPSFNEGTAVELDRCSRKAGARAVRVAGYASVSGAHAIVSGVDSACAASFISLRACRRLLALWFSRHFPEQ